MDCYVGAEGAAVDFHVENIYGLNQSAFGSERKYDVTEMGLIPFVTKYINHDFRAYTRNHGQELLALWYRGQPKRARTDNALHVRAGARKASPEFRGAIPSLDIGTERKNGLMSEKLTLQTSLLKNNQAWEIFGCYQKIL